MQFHFRTYLVLLVLIVATAQGGATQPVMRQPTSKDVQRTIGAIRKDERCPQQAQFISCGPKDLEKYPVVAPQYPNQILTIVRDRLKRNVHEVTTDQITGAVIEWKKIDKVQPMLSSDEYDSAAAIVRKHVGWQKSIKRRGLDSTDLAIDIWASGIPISSMKNRIVRAITYVKSKRKTNLYDRPVEGLVCTVNLDFKSVVEFFDVDVAPVPPAATDFNDVYKKSKRKPLSSLRTIQNANQAIKITGSSVEWDNWRFEVLLHPREGLVLHNVRFVDGGAERKVAHRLGLSEMVVPYGDTSRYWYWRNAFDVGEYGVGNLTTPLTVGSDLPENSRTLDAALVLTDGSPLEIKKAIGLYEKDAGVVWKHADPFTGENRIRRGRELVVTSTAVVGNYDYSLSYIMCLDGTIKVDVALTGILLPKGVPDTTYNVDSPFGQMFGSLVSKNVVAPSHQHFFSFRLDMDIDGEKNSVSEVDQWQPPVEENRYNNAIKMDDYELLFEKEAARNMSQRNAREWRVASTTTKNGLGGYTSYLLVPGGNSSPFLTPETLVRKRAGFIDYQFWTTRFHDNELYSAGDYPNQSVGLEGMHEYVSNNESLRGKDVVLWYTMGVTHQPRPEDWPVMPTVHTGFMLRPMGFFDRNPTLDLAPLKP